MGALSGAVGTYAANGPELEAAVLERLGLVREDVSTQVVARDRHAQYLNAIALAGAGLERFATEVRHLQRTEVREVEEPFKAGQKGSSAMPHKRNPITTERITGIARLLRGYAQTGLENVALWHERDISHSSAERVALPDASILLDYAQSLAVRVVEGMTVHTDRMRANLDVTSGALFSQRALLALVETGMSPRRRLPGRPGERPEGVGHGHALPRPARRRRIPGSTWTRSSTRPRLLLTRRSWSRSSTSWTRERKMAELQEITSGLAFPEGPIAMSDGSVIVTEIQAGRITRVGAGRVEGRGGRVRRRPERRRDRARTGSCT